MVDDFKASGKSNLERDSLTVQPTNGWLAVYALIKVMRDAKATDITRATVKAAFDKAKDIPMFDLTPPWTPVEAVDQRGLQGHLEPELLDRPLGRRQEGVRRRPQAGRHPRAAGLSAP